VRWQIMQRLIAKVIGISRAKFHCNRRTTVQNIQDYAILIFGDTVYFRCRHETLWHTYFVIFLYIDNLISWIQKINVYQKVQEILQSTSELYDRSTLVLKSPFNEPFNCHIKGVLQRTFFISTNERLMYKFYKNCNYFIFK